jgi:hypothetical protein
MRGNRAARGTSHTITTTTATAPTAAATTTHGLTCTHHIHAQQLHTLLRRLHTHHLCPGCHMITPVTQPLSANHTHALCSACFADTDTLACPTCLSGRKQPILRIACVGSGWPRTSAFFSSCLSCVQLSSTSPQLSWRKQPMLRIACVISGWPGIPAVVSRALSSTITPTELLVCGACLLNVLWVVF